MIAKLQIKDQRGNSDVINKILSTSPFYEAN